MACTNADFAYLRAVVYEQSANVLEASRDYLFEPRLSRLIEEGGFATLSHLVNVLRERPDPAMKRSIAEAMTVNETSFFRDRVPFDLMRLDLLPALIAARARSRRLRLWSAACSTGQEACSLAMMLLEYFPRLRDWQIEIVGTDISAAVVARARAGLYRRMEVNRGLPARFLLKYAERDGDEWRMRPEVRRLCRFYRRNLADGPLLMGTFDGVLLRNVMLYFASEARRRLLMNVHRILAPDGFLILGSSEQPCLPKHFRAVTARTACCYKPLPGKPPLA